MTDPTEAKSEAALWKAHDASATDPTETVVVPREPTEAMQNEGVNVASDLIGYADEGQVNAIYRAMLSAAPSQPVAAPTRPDTEALRIAREALELAANRIDRLTLETPFDSGPRFDGAVWANGARNAAARIAALGGEK